MALIDDGNLICGLGYVALYAAYLEEEIDGIFSLVVSVDGNHRSGMDRWQTSRKLDHINRSIGSWSGLTPELKRFLSHIDPLKDLLEKRNLIIHGRIYANPRTGDVIKPARVGYPEIPAVSADLYDLANQLLAARDPCLRASRFAIPRYALRRSG
jgi:hypothetical protein